MRVKAVRAIASGATVFLIGSGAPVFAQGRMIVLSATAVQQGQSVRVMSPACTTATTVLVDKKVFPATANGSAFDLPTASLAPGTHEVTTDCGGSASDPVSLTVVPTKQAEMPTVMCARNASPRDGAASPLTSAAAATERQTVDAARKKAEADRTAYPTPEEVTRLLSRCDKDWAWTLRLEDRLSLNVAGLADWRQVEENKQATLHLFVDGIELGNMALRRVAADGATKTETLETIVTFDTDATTPEERAAMRTALAQVLRTARTKAWNFGTSEMAVSIGPAGGPQWPSTARIQINPYPTGLTWFGVIGVALLVILIVVLAVRTPLLRDGGSTAPFSLAKNQMALWFLVIVGSFLFITVTTGQAAAMSTTALTLIGISGATGLAAVAIDSRKRSVESNEKQRLEAERNTLTQEIDGDGGLRQKRAATADGSAEAAQLDALILTKLQRIDVVTKKLADMPPPQVQTTQGWLTDILSDEHGISFHRLQMAGWTAALVGVFVVAVWRTFAMADFDATMLGLLGISSGTYLGFKFPERDTTSGTPNR